jgi:hypothetical protein
MEKFYPNLDLKFLANCPICDCRYGSDEIKILDKKEGIVTLYFVCAQCKSAIVSAVSAGVLGVTAISIVTDLGASETDKIKNTEAVSSDDVLSIYNFLKAQKRNNQLNNESI